MKKFTTIGEQIALLSERGLVIGDRERAELYLLSNNYYNIINGYGKFLTGNGEQFLPGTTFDEITQLYSFDRKLKQTLFQSILTVELHVKSIFAHRFAERFPDEKYAYLNINSYDKSHTLSVIDTIAKLARIVRFQRGNTGSSIAHYVANHHDVPIWVLVNYLEFGELRHMLMASPDSVQNSVARDLMGFIKQNITSAGFFPPATMLSFLANINDVRNICAHNNRLLGYQCRRDNKYWQPLHAALCLDANTERRSVYSVILSMQCFLSANEYAYLHDTVRNLIQGLDNHLHLISVNNILDSLGFPNIRTT